LVPPPNTPREQLAAELAEKPFIATPKVAPHKNDVLPLDTGLPDEKLAQMAHDQQRIMLTRDRGLLMRNIISHGYCLRTKDGVGQVTAVLYRYQLHGQIRPWTRCLRCNGYLQPVPKAQIIERLQPKTKRFFNEFQICIDCEQIYWKGSHFEALENLVACAQAVQ